MQRQRFLCHRRQPRHLQLRGCQLGLCIKALCLRPSAQTLRPSDVGRLHRHDVGVLFPAGVATTPAEVAAAEANAAVESLDAGACLAACVRSDRPDGLFTTVVADECGRALGLVYSNGVSVAESIRCGRGVYYSRSR